MDKRQVRGLFAGILIFSAGLFAQAGKFAADLGIFMSRPAYGAGSMIALDEPEGSLKISGITDQYLGAELTLVQPQDLSGRSVSFEFKGDPGDLYVKLFNSDDSATPCMSFAAYKKIDASEWKTAKLMMGGATGGFSWKGEGVNGAAPGSIDRLQFAYRPEKKGEPVALEIRNLKLEKAYVPEFKRIIAPELTLKDIQPEASVTTLIKNGKPVASVIVPGDRDLTADEKQALNLLNETYGVQFPLYKLKKGQLMLPDGNYILFSDGVKGLIANRLLNRFYIDPEPGFYEVRNIRNAFQNSCNILYFGGLPESKILDGVRHFIDRQPKTGSDLLIGKYIDSEKYSTETPVDPDQAAAEALQKIRAVYASDGGTKNQEAIRPISNFARLYNNTGDERLIAPFMELVRVMIENYESAKTSKKPPSFRAYELAFAVDLMDESESFSNDDLLLCGNLLRQVTEDCMNYYEMREPMHLYDSGEIKYLTNHPLHASESVNAMGLYLKKRFRIPAADYWIAVSEYAFKATDEVQGPEDSGHYQWSCRRLYDNVALQSGALPLLTPNLKSYIDFAIAHFNQMGNAASYGDAIPIKGYFTPIYMLIDGYKFYDDSLSGHVLNSISTDNDFINNLTFKMDIPKNISYQPRMVGLTVFPLCDFLKEYYDLKTNDELLNKAVFRSGYEPSDEYMMLGGINLPIEHGNLDANAIIEYSRGDRYWLVDGHYVRKYPQDHNTILVSCDATLPDQRSYASAPPITEDQFARVDGAASAPDGSMGITATTLCNYSGTDWTRNIFWSSLNGFWVIDRLNVKESGHYVVKCIWRTLGDVTVTGDTVTVAQKTTPESSSPDRLAIARGDRAVTTVTEQMDVGHTGSFGYYDIYPFSGPETKVISEINNLDLKKGAQIDYANLFKTGFGDDMKQPQIRKAGDSAWIADCRQLAVLGSFQWFDKLTTGGLEITLTADRALITTTGILAINATKLLVGDQAVALPRGKTFFCKFGEGVLAAITPEKIRQLLDSIYNSAKPISLQELPQVNAPELPVKTQFETTAPVTAMTTLEDRVVCGFGDGGVIGYDLQGQPLWQTKVNAPVTVLCPVNDGTKTLWAVGTRYDNRESQTGTIGLISGTGNLLWQKPVAPYCFSGVFRPGTIRTITTAKLLPGKEPQIIAGSEAWKYMAFNLSGKEIWKFGILHSATVCAAADMTGDGLDEIAVGTEYPTHWIISNEGKSLKKINSGNGDASVAMIDVTGDGLAEAIFGREDGYIKAMRPGKEEAGYLWEANVGGVPTGIVKAPNGGMAVSTTGNAVVFVNNAGEQTGVVYFPDALSGIKNINGVLYTVCRDGFVYQLSGNRIVGKVKIPEFKAGMLLPPMLDAAGTHPVVACGRQVLVID